VAYIEPVVNTHGTTGDPALHAIRCLSTSSAALHGRRVRLPASYLSGVTHFVAAGEPPAFPVRRAFAAVWVSRPWAVAGRLRRRLLALSGAKAIRPRQWQWDVGCGLVLVPP
jgi:hypothetical protein